MSGLSGSGPTSSGRGSGSSNLVEVWVESGELDAQGEEVTDVSVSNSLAAVSTTTGWTWIYETNTWNLLIKLTGDISAIDENSTMVCSFGGPCSVFGNSSAWHSALVLQEEEEEFGRLADLSDDLALVASRDVVHFYNDTTVPIGINATSATDLALDRDWALISAGEEVSLYDLRNGGTRRIVSENGRAVGLGGSVAVVSNDDETFVYDLDTLELLETLGIGADSLAVAENDVIAIGSRGRGLRIVGSDAESTSVQREDVRGFAAHVAASSNFVLAAGIDRIFAYERQLDVDRRKTNNNSEVFGAYILLCVLVVIFYGLLVYYKKRRPYDDGTFCPSKARSGAGEQTVTQATDPIDCIPLALASSASFDENAASDVQLARPVSTVDVALPYEQSDIVTAAAVVAQPAPASSSRDDERGTP